jgi:hypothetical protein
MRKVRKDSKLHGLPKEQRAMVNKWLFDKGLTYQQVSEACFTMFGLKVSRSSVGRYYEREARGKVRRMKDEGRKEVSGWVSGKADKEVGGWARQMCIGMLTGRGETEGAYQKTLARMTTWALAEMQWPVEDERDLKGVLRMMRILISARREKNEAMMVELARRKFETRAVKECVKHWRLMNGDLQVEPRKRSREKDDRRRAAKHERETWYLGI